MSPGRPTRPEPWGVAATLAVTETVSYGVLFYAFPVVLAEMERDLAWSQMTLTGAYSLAALVSGVFAIPVGRWVDRYGARVVMTTGSVVASLLVVAWSRSERVVAFYLVWAGLGACMAAVFYEPAFTVVAQWFRVHRARALTVITVAGGLASTIFVPFTAALLTRGGWRWAILCLAGVLAALTIPAHALLPAGRPPHADAPDQPSIGAREALRGDAFRWITVAFFLSSLANIAFAVHLIPLLLERGHSLAFASVALAAVGFMKVPGRLVMAPLLERWSTHASTVAVFSVQAAGLLALATLPGGVAVWVCVALFGAGDGASTTARAALVADRFGAREYGAILGAMALFLALARSGAPLGGSVVREVGGGYGLFVWLLLAILVGAAAALRAIPPGSPGADAGARVPAASFSPVRRLQS